MPCVFRCVLDVSICVSDVFGCNLMCPDVLKGCLLYTDPCCKSFAHVSGGLVLFLMSNPSAP